MFHPDNKFLKYRRQRCIVESSTNTSAALEIVTSKLKSNATTTLPPSPQRKRRCSTQPVKPSYTDVVCPVNEIKQAIRDNDPIEDKLNVIFVISNACLYSRRYVLLKELVTRIEIYEPDVRLFTVELAYGDQPYAVTSSVNPRHLQLRTNVPLWHKENMVNIAVKQLLEPLDYKAFAWIDTDLDFDSATWAMDTLKILNGTRDVVQLFSHCVDMERDTSNRVVFNSFGFNIEKWKSGKKPQCAKFFHPGYAWAMTRTIYERIGGLYDLSILGSADNVMALAFTGKVETVAVKPYSDDYIASMIAFQKRAKGVRIGYTPGIIRHYYHGTKENRKYTDRFQILLKYDYSPTRDVVYDRNGVIVPTPAFPLSFQHDIFSYFQERKEDD